MLILNYCNSCAESEVSVDLVKLGVGLRIAEEVFEDLQSLETVTCVAHAEIVHNQEGQALVHFYHELAEGLARADLIHHDGDYSLDEGLGIRKEVVHDFFLDVGHLLHRGGHVFAPAVGNVGTEHLKHVSLFLVEVRLETQEVI